MIVALLVGTLLCVQCGGRMSEGRELVRWSASGVPPAYIERQWRADVPDQLRPAFDQILRRIRFFDLPADLGPNPPQGRDMGSYSITVEANARTHTVRYTDASVTPDVAELRTWIVENLQRTATPED